MALMSYFIDMHAFMEARNQLLSLCGSFGLWMINCIPDLNVTRVNLHQLPESLSLSLSARWKCACSITGGGFRCQLTTSPDQSLRTGITHRLALGWVWPLPPGVMITGFSRGNSLQETLPAVRLHASIAPGYNGGNPTHDTRVWDGTSSASSPGETCPRSWHAEGAELVQKCLCFLQFWLVESFSSSPHMFLFYCPVCSVLDWWVSRIILMQVIWCTSGIISLSLSLSSLSLGL